MSKFISCIGDTKLYLFLLSANKGKMKLNQILQLFSYEVS